MPYIPPEDIALMIPIVALCIPIVAIVTNHQRKVLELRLLHQRGGSTQVTSDAVRAELEALRAEMAAVRDTTTRFDLSFDAALTQVEERLDAVETVGAPLNVEPVRSSFSVPVVEAEPAVLRQY